MNPPLFTNEEDLNLNPNAQVMSLQEIGKLKAPFKLAPLPYLADSLEPVIGKETMEIHHGQHHQTYIDKLNKLIEASFDKNQDLQTILSKLAEKGPEVRNNAGGHWNHTFFWTLLSGDKKNQEIPERLMQAIEESFDSLDDFKEKFQKAGADQFGSGWVWLIRDANGKLAITTTSNQDNPLMDVAKVKGRPILTVDVWEHAYYLGYQNKRDQYLKSIWDVINWNQVDAYDREVTAH